MPPVPQSIERTKTWNGHKIETKNQWYVFTDFPLLEYNEKKNRWIVMHHPITATKPEDIPLLETNLGAVRANACDMGINGLK